MESSEVAVAPPSVATETSLERAVGQGLVRLDGEGNVIVPEGTLVCPLCSVVGLPEYVFGKARSVRRHIREQHGVPVAAGNARLGRPRAAVVVDHPGDQRALRRSVIRYQTRGVTAKEVRRLADEVDRSVLSLASMAATLVEGLEPVAKYHPGFRPRLERARMSLRAAEEHVAAGWLPPSVDMEHLAADAIPVAKFLEWADDALELCVNGRVMEGFPRAQELVAHVRGTPVECCPMLHLDATWGEVIWEHTRFRAVEHAKWAFRPELSVGVATHVARAFIVPWVLGKILNHHLRLIPGSPGW
ncbi:hypothetical protein V1523DRAFT_420410, partial [Lipomyces doorenjongii]